MDIKLYTFSEALEKLKKNEITRLIRAKYMDADFIHKCILLYNTSKYIALGTQYCLWQTTKNEKGERVSSYAKVDSDDILAEDYIDTSQWTLCNCKDDYNNFITKEILENN